MAANRFSQKHVYDENGKKISYLKQKISLELIAPTVNFLKPSIQVTTVAPVLESITEMIDLGLKLTTKFLENRVKKFSSEYTFNQSYLQAGTGDIPTIKFTRQIKRSDDSTFERAIEFIFEPKKIDDLAGFVYCLKGYTVNKSEAKVTKKDNTLDYAIELKPTLFADGKKKVHELSPISITSVEFNDTPDLDCEYRTDIIPVPADGKFLGVSIKIIETNPAQIKAEKILEVFNESKENIKTIINNFIPKPKEEDKPQPKPNPAPNPDPNKPKEE